MHTEKVSEKKPIPTEVKLSSCKNWKYSIADNCEVLECYSSRSSTSTAVGLHCSYQSEIYFLHFAMRCPFQNSIRIPFIFCSAQHESKLQMLRGQEKWIKDSNNTISDTIGYNTIYPNAWSKLLKCPKLRVFGYSSGAEKEIGICIDTLARISYKICTSF